MPEQSLIPCQPASFPYKPIAPLRQQDTCDHIGKNVLSGRQCGDADCQCHHHRKHLVPFWNSHLFSDSDHAEPARQAMNGREQIICRIRPVQPAHGILEKACTYNFRSDIGRRKQQKAGTADQLCKAFCTQKMFGFTCFLPASQRIIDHPEQVASQIDCNYSRYQWNASIECCCHIIVVHSPCDEPCAVIGQDIDDQGNRQIYRYRLLQDGLHRMRFSKRNIPSKSSSCFRSSGNSRSCGSG